MKRTRIPKLSRHWCEHEKPSIGILLCSEQDTEVVKYALNRSLSPAMVAAYQTQLPDKELLQQKLRLYYG